MKTFAKFLIAAILVFPATAALAADLTVEFSAPSVGSNQRPIASYTLYENCGTSPTVMYQGITSSPTTIPNQLQVGNSYSLCLAAVDIDGRVGPFSNVVNLNIVGITPPNAPGNFRIQVQCSNCLVTVEGQ